MPNKCILWLAFEGPCVMYQDLEHCSVHVRDLGEIDRAERMRGQGGE